MWPRDSKTNTCDRKSRFALWDLQLFLNSTEEGQVFTEPRPRVHNVVYHVCRLLMSSHKTTQDVGLWKIRDYTHHVKCRTTFHARSKK